MSQLLLLVTTMFALTSIVICGPISPQVKISDAVYRILERMPVIDGHNDFPWTTKRLIGNDLRLLNFSSDLTTQEPWSGDDMSQTDIPRLRRGRVGAQFWVAYTECRSNYKDSVANTLEQIDVIQRLAEEYKDDLHFSTSVADIELALSLNKTASLIGVEGGHSIQSSFSVLRQLYAMGARYMTLTHSCNLPWADASPVDAGSLPPVNDGLSEFGLQVVNEMNRIGMMVDLSHVSVEAMRAALRRSRAPVIFSHSSARAVCNHHRNVPDDVLEMVKENGGVVMVNFYAAFIQCALGRNATVEDVMDHIEHIATVAGFDAVGIGADYDGVTRPPIDLPDVSFYPVLFEGLLQRGWSEENLEKLAGRNLLRVFRKVEEIRDEMAESPVQQDLITRTEVERANISTDCVSYPFIDDMGNHINSVYSFPN